MLLCWPFEGLHIKISLIGKTSSIDHDRKRNEPFTSRDVCQRCYLDLGKKIFTYGENRFTGNMPTDEIEAEKD